MDAVAQVVETLCYKPEGSIPDKVITFFFSIRLMLSAALWAWS
jgi:hypothetical protein